MIGATSLPILVYHRFSDEQCSDRFTVSQRIFELQLQYLHENGYRSIRFSDLLTGISTRGIGRRVLLTIDDGYECASRFAIPLLKRYGFSATCFIPVGLIGEQNEWDGGGRPLMNEATLRALPSDQVEIALHSWRHIDYRTLSATQIAADLWACRSQLDALRIPYVPVLAYPFGRVPCDLRAQGCWRTAIRKAGISMACRVGNRLNNMPLRDPYMLTRTNVRGDEAHWKFRVKVALGRSKPF